MSRKPERDRLVSAAVIAKRQARVNDWLRANEGFLDAKAVNVARYILGEWEEAVDEAGEVYLSTAEAARMSGWSPATLQARAQEMADARTPARGWEGLEVQRTPKGWSFKASTIPLKGRMSA